MTGGAGFIGSHLVEALVGKGYRVRVLDDLATGNMDNLRGVMDRVEFIRGSIADRPLVHDAIDGTSCVFHLAAVVSVQKSFTEPEESHEVNATGVLNVLTGCAKAKAKLIHSSSAAVYGQDVEQPVVETAALAPISPYGAQKLYGENLLKSYVEGVGLKGVSLRYFNVYGPRQDPANPYSGVISIFVKRISQGLPITIYGDGQQTRDFIHVSDIVRANVMAFESTVGDGRAMNIGTGIASNLLQLAAAIGDACAVEPVVLHELARIGDIRDSCSNASLAEGAIGFKAQIGLGEGIRSLVTSSVTSR